jgi:hypothetical protein
MAMNARDKILKAAREAYVEPDAFPETYEQACDKELNLGDGLARFIAIEIWEVTEGHDDLVAAGNEAICALEKAESELAQVRRALEIMVFVKN